MLSSISAKKIAARLPDHITEEDVKKTKELLELEWLDEKAEAQKHLAWAAMGSIFLFTLILFTPIVGDQKVKALADLLGLFYIAQAGVIGAYMGVTAWMSSKRSTGDE